MIFYGAALILVIMSMPLGIAGFVTKIRYQLTLRRLGGEPQLGPAAETAAD